MPTLTELRSAQPHVVDILVAAVASGRLHHAYLLVAAELGVAEQIGRALASSLVCEAREGVDGCGTCQPCHRLDVGTHPDVITIVPNEKGMIPIDVVRDATRRLGLSAAQSATKVVLVSQADQMNGAAQNALLKTLEEPAGATCFVLTSVRPRALLPTVRSRCQQLRLTPNRGPSAWQTLARAGLAEELARPLAGLVGTDVARAQQLASGGAAEILASLRRALKPGASDLDLLSAAAELGAERDKADLALAFFEVELRDALARRHGARDDQLYAASRDASFPQTAVAGTIARMQQLRKLAAFNLNRTLAIETLLLGLTGRLPARVGGPGESIHV